MAEPKETLKPAAVVTAAIRAIHDSDVEELEVRMGGVSLRLVQTPLKSRPAGEDSTAVETPASPGSPIAAPLTGVYYARPSPERPPFVNSGDPVSIGQVVALIETMKLFNEVVSEIDGVVLNIPVKDGDLVEKGKPLMFLEIQDFPAGRLS